MESQNQLTPGEQFFEKWWLLLILGFVIPTVSYTIWGWVELMMLEPAALP